MGNAKLGTSYDDKFAAMELGKLRAERDALEAELSALHDSYALSVKAAESIAAEKDEVIKIMRANRKWDCLAFASWLSAQPLINPGRAYDIWRKALAGKGGE